MADTQLTLLIRTPTRLLYQGTVNSIVAEDLDGWFGIRNGRPDIVSVLPAGLLRFVDAQGEAFVANGGGVLELRSGICRVALRSAVLERDSQRLAEAIDEQQSRLEQRAEAQHQVLDQLLKEAVRRTVRADPRFWELAR